MKTNTHLSGKYNLFFGIKQWIVEKTEVRVWNRKLIGIVVEMIFFCFFAANFDSDEKDKCYFAAFAFIFLLKCPRIRQILGAV